MFFIFPQLKVILFFSGAPEVEIKTTPKDSSQELHPGSYGSCDHVGPAFEWRKQKQGVWPEVLFLRMASRFFRVASGHKHGMDSQPPDFDSVSKFLCWYILVHSSWGLRGMPEIASQFVIHVPLNSTISDVTLAIIPRPGWDQFIEKSPSQKFQPFKLSR